MTSTSFHGLSSLKVRLIGGAGDAAQFSTDWKVSGGESEVGGGMSWEEVGGGMS